MVAPYQLGDPVRSFVRVPGSGSDKTAKSLCCDLSRVSSAAASVPIRPIAQTTTAVLTPTSTPPVQQQNQNAQPIKEEVQETEEKGTNEQAINRNQQRKRPITENTEVKSMAKRSRILKEVKTEENDASETETSNKKGKECAADEKLINLEKQCEQLKKQNQQLQQRLALFCKLFKDPKKLELALKCIKG